MGEKKRVKSNGVLIVTMDKEIFVEDETLQDDIIEYAGWKLYSENNFPKSGRLDDLMCKRKKDGKLVIKNLVAMADLDRSDKCFDCSLKEDIVKIRPEEVAFQLGEGVFKVGNVELEYVFTKEIYTTNHTMCPYKRLWLRGKEDDICNFISDMDNYQKSNDKTNVKVYGPSSKGYWEILCKNPRRDVKTVFVDKKKEILEDIDEFLRSETDYRIFGHPYKRNYLFYGPPGNGKTSFINAIGSKYNLNLYLISFSQSITDEIFKKLVSGLSYNSLLVMEDIDVLFTKENRSLTMSTVLNTLDGLARKNRVICVMTTNHFEKLTDVFKRPGRLDMIVQFNKADKDCFKEMAKFICEYREQDVDDNIVKKAESFYDSVSHMEPSRALVQKFLFENRKKNPEEIFTDKMVKQFRKINDLYTNVEEEKSVINLYS